MVDIKALNAHERPPESMRQAFKKYRTLQPSDIDSDPRILDLRRLNADALPDGLYLDGWLSGESASPTLDAFMNCASNQVARRPQSPMSSGIPIYSHHAIPGLRLLPSLLPPAVQIEMLCRLLHRDLSDERHQTNVHLHYHMSYPEHPGASASCRNHDSQTPVSDVSQDKRVSYFQDDPDRVLHPKDNAVHLPLTIRTFLDRKLRWITLGGQYNWTDKRYPPGIPPAFPKDIFDLLSGIFPETEAQAGIVNVYSPGDTLSVHRDVSEECDMGLISISFGCDGLFMVGHKSGSGCEVIRLRSGDAIYMTGESRFSWHAVPKVIPSTCPVWLKDWPYGAFADTPEHFRPLRQWQGWMSGKRVNLNVRQMVETSRETLTPRT